MASFGMAAIHVVGIPLSIITGILGAVAVLTYSSLSDLQKTYPELETLNLRHTISLAVSWTCMVYFPVVSFFILSCSRNLIAVPVVIINEGLAGLLIWGSQLHVQHLPKTNGGCRSVLATTSRMSSIMWAAGQLNIKEGATDTDIGNEAYMTCRNSVLLLILDIVLMVFLMLPVVIGLLVLWYGMRHQLRFVKVSLRICFTYAHHCIHMAGRMGVRFQSRRQQQSSPGSSILMTVVGHEKAPALLRILSRYPIMKQIIRYSHGSGLVNLMLASKQTRNAVIMAIGKSIDPCKGCICTERPNGSRCVICLVPACSDCAINRYCGNFTVCSPRSSCAATCTWCFFLESFIVKSKSTAKRCLCRQDYDSGWGYVCATCQLFDRSTIGQYVSPPFSPEQIQDMARCWSCHNLLPLKGPWWWRCRTCHGECRRKGHSQRRQLCARVDR